MLSTSGPEREGYTRLGAEEAAEPRTGPTNCDSAIESRPSLLKHFRNTDNAGSSSNDARRPSGAAAGVSKTAAAQADGKLRTAGPAGSRASTTGPGETKLPQSIRQKDKFVPLPDPGSAPDSSDNTDNEMTPSMAGAIATEQRDYSKGRITVYCIAESLDRKVLDAMLYEHYKPEEIHAYQDVVHLHSNNAPNGVKADIFFFEFGVIICWGLEQAQEAEVIQRIGGACERGPYEHSEVEIDEFQFKLSANEPPHIQNDMITINKRQAVDYQVRLAISHALAQSTKLSVYEERVVDLVEETKHLPEALAKHGTVDISTKKVAQLIGKVFLQNSTVNLLSTVLDTPEFFWSAPDSMQALYERACEYLELDTRVKVLNARFQVLQEMLDMLRDHQNNSHASRLEWIIIWLLLVDVVLMLFQLLSLFGIVG